jgi:hypothetical protein
VRWNRNSASDQDQQEQADEAEQDETSDCRRNDSGSYRCGTRYSTNHANSSASEPANSTTDSGVIRGAGMGLLLVVRVPLCLALVLNPRGLLHVCADPFDVAHF